jgi:lysophospholipase L1-like esterase
MRFRPLAIVGAFAALLAGTLSVSASSEQNNAPKHYYLALGDSLAYGYQDAKFKAEAAAGDIDAATFPGYAGDFAGMLREVRENVRLVNYGCPGETTASYFVGCAFSAVGHFPLHNAYSGSQEAAALAFLRAHRGQVSPITLDNGANDVTPCLQSPDPNCFANALAAVGANLNTALAHLRAAAPHAEIIVMQYYDPFAAAAPATLGTTEALNHVIGLAAAAHGALLADAFTPFNLAQPQPATLCSLTFFCASGDIHATDLGYRVIARQFWTASGFGREDED